MFNSKNLKNSFFLLTLAALFIGFLYIFMPFLGIFFIAIILVELFYPWYKFLLKKFKFPFIATTLASLSVILSVVIPIIFLLVIIAIQGQSLITEVSKFWEDKEILSQLNSTISKINEIIANFSNDPKDQITSAELKNFATDISQSAINSIIDTITSSVSVIANFVTKLFLMIILIFALFPNKEKIYKLISDLSPLDNNLDEMFIKNFKETSQNVLLGTFFVALGLGVIGGVTFWAIGIDAPVFWGMMIALASLIPVGSGLVWFPTVIILFIKGQTIEAIILFIIGMLMSYVFDTYLRMLVTKKESQIHPLLLAFAILGGVEVFGVLGFIYGPLIVVSFFSIMRVYKQKFDNDHKLGNN